MTTSVLLVPLLFAICYDCRGTTWQEPLNKTPVVESGGSSVGKKGVCDGIGTEFIDIGNASSRMKVKELEYCDANGVKVTEIKVGYDGIVVANSKEEHPCDFKG